MPHLSQFIPKVIADDRERGSGIVELLENRGITAEVKRLRNGDYHIGAEWVIERKTSQDFVQSIIDGRLFRQVARLKRYTSRPILLIEGNPFHTRVNIDPNAVRGAILTIQSVWYMPALYSRSSDDSADILAMLARYALAKTDSSLKRAGYKPIRPKKMQIYILCGLPGIGPVIAKKLLEEFKTIAAVMTADPRRLAKVNGIGKKTAQKIRGLLDMPYSLDPPESDFEKPVGSDTHSDRD